jgi:uncharacterized protein
LESLILDSHGWDLFQCKRCGQCCKVLGLPELSWKDLEEIPKFLNITKEEYIERYYGTIIEKNGEEMIKRYVEDRRRPCPFLENNISCKIYSVRPVPCRAYPLETDFGRCNIDCPGAKSVYDEPESE